jgi:hypothetical protein
VHPHAPRLLDDRPPAHARPDLGLYPRLERLETVDGELRGDTTYPACDEARRRGELGRVRDLVPVFG